MATSLAKKNILKRIREALINPVPLPFPESEGNNSVFVQSNDEPIVVFAEEFTKLQGRLVFCTNEADFYLQLQQLILQKNWQKIYCNESALQEKLRSINILNSGNLPTCDVAITFCEYLVARTGSIVLSTAQQSGRTASVYAPIHICVAYSNQLVNDVEDALQLMKQKYADSFPSFITFASGPSRTADIEKTLVTGVHGPKEVFCFLIDNQ